MLTVKTYIDTSEISGIGLFAEEAVAKGTVIWTPTDVLTVCVPLETYEGLPDPAKRFLLNSGYLKKEDENHIWLDIDNARFINHSDDPNTIENDREELLASRAIAAGEEITVNYYESFDENRPFYLQEKKRFGLDGV